MSCLGFFALRFDDVFVVFNDELCVLACCSSTVDCRTGAIGRRLTLDVGGCGGGGGSRF